MRLLPLAIPTNRSPRGPLVRSGALLAVLAASSAVPTRASVSEPSEPAVRRAEPEDVSTDDDGPAVVGSVPVEIQLDDTYDSDDPDAERRLVFALIEPEITVALFPAVSVYAHGVLEQVRDTGAGENGVFQHHGFFLEDLFLVVDLEPFDLKAGKFTPNFGIAWDVAPGLYGTDVAEGSYEFTERVGAEASWTMEPDAESSPTLSASTFFLDTSILTRSVGSDREPRRVDLDEGGVSNTEDLSSFAVALDGHAPETLGGVRYHMAYSDQARGRGGEKDQHGWAAALEHRVSIGDELEIAPLVEVVRLSDVDGTARHDRTHVTLGTELRSGPWHLDISYTRTREDLPHDRTYDDDHVQVSLGYDFDCGVTVDVGWVHSESFGDLSKTAGARVSYTFEF
jgi:hypothetical protein